MIPDAFLALDYMLDRFAWVVDGMTVRPDRMLVNLDATHGLAFSGRVLLKLVEAGLPREAAYAVVQRNAMRAWETGEQLRDLIAADPEAASVPPAVLDDAFDLEAVLRNAHVPFDRALREKRSLNSSTR